jgi:hypothetical protein
MKSLNPKKYIIGTLLMVPTLHLVFVSLIFLPLFDYVLANKHRMLDIRKFDHLTSIEKVETQMGFAKHYLLNRLKNSKKPIILVTGNSFNYGYCLNEKLIYSYYLQKSYPNHHVVNMSVIGFSLEGTIGILKLIEELNIDVSTLIFDANLASYVSGARSENAYASSKPRSIPTFFLKNPPIWDSANLIFKDCHDQETSGFVRKRLEASKFRFQAGKGFDSQFRSAFEISSRISANVIFFIDPYVEEEFKHFNINTSGLQKAAKRYTAICKTYGNIKCFNLLFNFDKNYFIDYAHLNILGHNYIHDWLNDYIK